MKKLSILVKSVMLTLSMVNIANANSSWTGFYAGVDAGVAFNNAQLSSQQLGFTNPSEKCNASSNYSTFFPGIQLGYMYQFHNNLVTSLEASASVNTDQHTVLGCNSDINPDVYDRFTFRNQMQSSIKGRIGRPMNWDKNSLLPYLTAGASFADVGLTYKNEGGDYYSTTTTKAGWLLGAGIEWAFMQHWSVRAEYYYLGYGNTINLRIPSLYGLEDPNGKAHVNLSSNNVVVVLNYWI